MSQRDLVAELRAGRIAAPAEVRERVRLIAAHATPERRVFTWRRALVVALPAAAAVAAAVVLTRPTADQPVAEQRAIAHGAVAAAPKATDLAPFSTQARVQRYNASLSLRLHDATDVSNAVKTVQRIAASLGGFPVTIQADAHGRAATADLVVKVPRARVQEAIRRFSALGTITGEDVHVQDLQTGLNAIDRLIGRLQRQLRAAKDPAQIAALTARIERLQRQESTTRRTAHYATVSVHLATPPAAAPSHGHGPWHGLTVGLRWLGIGAVYALVFGTPLVLLLAVARLVRRRREDALLSRS